MKISGKTKIFAVIGKPVDHSLSPAIHNAGYSAVRMDAAFVAFEPENARAAIEGARGLGITGLAVTIPFKVEAFDACDWTDDFAAKIGAVNTVLIGETIRGYNTDVPGIVEALEATGTNMDGLSGVVIGAGGAARAAVAALAQSGCARVDLLVRDPEKAKPVAKMLATNLSLPVALEQLGESASDDRVKKAGVLINATPIGLRDDEFPIDPALIRRALVLVDLAYRPGGTPLIWKAKTAGALTVPGESVLLEQALIQFKLHTGKTAPREDMNAALLGGKPA
jgi:shikimate dehydrogenase